MNSNLRKTAIICTIGPASEFILEDMLKAGMNVARINFSHGGKNEQMEKVERFKEVRDRLGVSAGLMLDTQGPEIRLGRFEESLRISGCELNEGDEIILSSKDILGDGKRFPISYKELYKDIEIGTNILLDDGTIILNVIDIKDGEIYTKVVDGGTIKERKSINVPGARLNLPALKPKDIEDILYGVEANFDFIAASFVRNANDVMAIRELLDSNGGNEIKIIAKIENQEGIDNIESILEVADGIMVARGDLAVEIPFEEVPFYQKAIIQKANAVGKPVVIATQMLESMTTNPRPTRAEASDVANAVYDRTSAIMLSGESAVGKYPLVCVRTMSKIAKNIESRIRYWDTVQLVMRPYATIDEKSAFITVDTAKQLSADAIIAYTHTGDSVRKIAGMNPGCPIFVVTDNKKTFNQLALTWGTMPMYIPDKESIDEMIEEGIRRLKDTNVLVEGDVLFITGGKDFISSAKESKRFGGVAII